MRPSSASTSTCPACGLPSSGAAGASSRCRECLAVGRFLDPDPATRWEALHRAKAKDRPHVLAAALRGGRLWDGLGPAGHDGGEALLGWLARTSPSLVFLRYLAEDSRYGGLAWGRLAQIDQERSLQRSPEWLASGQDPAPLIRAWRGQQAALGALAFRIGGSGLSAATRSRVLAATPPYARWWAGFAARFGQRRPSRASWYPSQDALDAAPSRRRWPIERIEEGGLVVCVMCGEALPATGSCRWCGKSPAYEAALVGYHGFFLERALCPRCGIDFSNTVPATCPGCGLDLCAARKKTPTTASGGPAQPETGSESESVQRS